MASQRIKGITIEIGGDTSPLVDALKEVDKAAAATGYNLKDINKALKLDPTNVSLLKTKQEELNNAVAEASAKLETEQQYLEELKKQDGFDENSRQAKDLKAQIELDKVALEQAQKALKDFGSVGSQQLKAVGSEIKEVGKKFEEVGKQVSQLGQDLTTKLSVPIATAIGGAVKVTADFDSQMSKVKAISGATGDEFDQLRDKAREMGASTKYSATEAGEAFEYMGMAGWKTEDMLNGISGIMNLAAASGEELGTTSDIVTDALTAFGLGAEDAGRFADILASAATNANTNVSMMGESFKYVAPVAGSLGYSAEDVAVALGLMANSGIKADMAGTSLRNMFQRMAKPTKESEAAMNRLGLSLADDEGNMYSFKEIMDQLRSSFSEINMSAEDYNAALDDMDQRLADGSLTQKKYDAELEELNKQAFGAEGAEKARAAAMLGGTRAMSGLLAIANASEKDYNDLTQAIYNSSDSFARLADGSVIPLSEALASGAEVIETYNGQAEAMAATMQDNLTGDITVLKSMLQELAISLGDLLMPTLREIVSGVQGVVDWLNSLDDSTKETILQVALVVAAVGPAILIIGKIITGIGGLITAIGTITSAIGAVTGVLAGLSAPMIAIPLAIAAIVAAIALCVTHWDQIKEAASKAAEVITQKWEEFKTKIKEIWDTTVNNIKTAVNNMKTNVSNVFNAVKTDVISKVTTLKSKAVETFENLKNSLKDKAERIKENILGAFSSAVEYITSLPQKALGWGRDIIDGLVSGIRNAIGSVTQVMSDVASAIADFIHFSEPDKGPLSNFHTFMPDMMRQMVQGIQSGIPKISDAMNSLAGSMAGSLQASGGMGGTTNNNNSTNTVTLNVYGAQGQDVNALASEIQTIINNQVYQKGAVFA